MTHSLARTQSPSRLSALLSPRSVAVIGASADALRIGGRPIAYMLERGYAGRILPVNPKRAEVQGLPAYASVAALPEVPDLAIVAVAAELTPAVVAELAERGTAAAILFTAGFAEASPEGAALQAQVVAAARRHGMRLLGPNSLGVVNPRNGFFGSFVSSVELGMPRAGRVGIVSQSGAYGGHLLAAATAAGIGLSSVVMTGNEADLTLGDVVQVMVDDPDTDVIALYSEGIREAEGLVAALEAARRARKPVVMMKVGRSAVGSAAAQSHTASIAGNDRVIDAVLAELGVVRAKSTEQMLDIARLATRRIYPASNTLGVITVSGGAGVIISDAAEDVGLPVPEMPAAAQAHLRSLLPFASPRNPVDTTAQFMNDISLVGRFTDTLVTEGGYRSVLGFFTYTGGAPTIAARLREQLRPVRERHPDRLFVLSLQASPEQIRGYEDDGFSVFEDPTRATVAIEAMGRFGRAFEAAQKQPAPVLPAVALPSHTPTEAQAKRLLAEAGIESAPERACAGSEAAVVAAREIGFPVVLKILSPDILHKSEIGGVLLGVADEAAVRAGYATLIERAGHAAPDARIEGVLVAKQLSGGVECILGTQRDPVFGPVAMFGLGGIFVEVMKDVVLHRCPFGDDVAEQMIRSIKGAPLLLGARGKPPSDIPALARMLSRLSAFAVAAGPSLQSIDLNPVFAMPAGEGAFAADAVIEIRRGD
ncbi:acetate--CoA ligase family protein [Piscinibacter sp.]|uniref:acetate--CoA ligase family protein n=1 Tax=Piscinibacter sp. TaxID=1903157 RepID=UPI002D154B92|nr:acetate--CoA ligase family protein [Albitalea sp.]HUG21092.1 acetate--CoA ligase family protein [Albitalea sp.]